MLLKDFCNYNNNQYELIKKYKKQIEKDQMKEGENTGNVTIVGIVKWSRIFTGYSFLFIMKNRMAVV